MTNQTQTVRFSTTRFNIESTQNADALRARYEQAAPPVPKERVEELVRRQAPWSDMLNLIDSAAPFGFLI